MQEVDETCSYVVNANDIIILVEEPIWTDFLKENKGDHLCEQMQNTSLWRWVSGPTTQYLYKMLLGKVRQSNRVLSFKFRCDASTTRRYMEMQLIPLLNKCVQFRSITRLTMERPPQAILDWNSPRSEKLLTMCTFCKKVQDENDSSRWMEVEQAVDAGLFSCKELPQIRHGCCGPCFNYVLNKSL